MPTERISHTNLRDFIIESREIEGLYTTPTVLVTQSDAYRIFLALDTITIGDVMPVLSIIQPRARLRNTAGMDVQIGNHTPPLGGPHIRTFLADLLGQISDNADTPFSLHRQFETLHPFTDGNGRTGRLCWLWQMAAYHYYDARLLFLHMWYYQSLSEPRPKRKETPHDPLSPD